jgi:hypothetical protein
VRAVCHRLRLPLSGWQVLGPDLNRSESGRSRPRSAKRKHTTAVSRRTAGFRLDSCRLGVKTGNVLIEQKISALTPKADIYALMSTRP